MTTQRAWSTLTLKSVSDEQRVIEGVASTPSTDRLGDVVDPHGADFELPIPLLWQHDATQPIGQVTHATVTPAGISITAQIARITSPGTLKDRIDEAWDSLKAKLVRGLSIGFAAVEYAYLDGGGIHFLKWKWLELSAVTIAANEDATISAIKALDMHLPELITLDVEGMRKARERLSQPGALRVRPTILLGREEGE